MRKPVYQTLFAATLLATLVISVGATRQRPAEEKIDYGTLTVDHMDIRGDGVSAKITLVRDPLYGCIYWYPSMTPRYDNNGTPNCGSQPGQFH
jgi:hypothetical protein